MRSTSSRLRSGSSDIVLDVRSTGQNIHLTWSIKRLESVRQEQCRIYLKPQHLEGLRPKGTLFSAVIALSHRTVLFE